MTGSKDERGGGVADFRVGFSEGDAAGESSEATAAFRILVIGAFTASADGATPPREPAAITAATFDEVMTEFDPSLALDLPDPGRGKTLHVPLSFKRLRSFRPEVLVQDVEAFRALREEDAPSPVAERTAETAPPGGGSLIDDILSGMAASAPPQVRPTARGGTGASKAALLQSILGHPEVRRLERAWRGLKLLVNRAALPRTGVTIEIMSAPIDDVDAAIARAASVRPAGAIDLIVVDYELGSQARDLQRAELWASHAQAIPAPLVTNARPEVLGFDDLDQLARTSRRVRGLEDPRAVAFQALTAKDAARWLVVAMNGPLLREAYTADTARLRDVPFEESAPLDGGAAWVVAVAAASAFTGCGWGSALTEPERRTVSNLTVHMANDRGSPVSLAVQSLVTSEVAGEAAAAGVTVITGVRDRDVAVLPFAPMAYRGPTGPQGVRAAAELTLADQLFVARMVPLITELGAAIPADADGATVRDTARIALLSLFGEDPAHGPGVEARLAGRPPVLEITLRPRGFCGVQIPEVTLSAALG